jgi:dTDP-4-dehydrorhamnose reductase
MLNYLLVFNTVCPKQFENKHIHPVLKERFVISMQKILVTGCGGMLGSSVYRFFKKENYEILATDIDLNEQWLSYLDVRDYENSHKIAIEFKPNIIIHLAALTNLEECEDNLKNTYNTNFLGTRNMSLICKELDIPLVYVSTAGVFDGKKEIYTETDIPNPINIYGKTKLYGEIAVENLLMKYFIVRAGWMVGGGKKDKKFVSYILSQIKSGNKIFNIVNDKFGVPTYTEDFAKNLCLLMNKSIYGKYHMACSGDASRVEIAKFILDTLNVKNIIINEVTSDFFQKDFPVERAPSERMINTNLISQNINIMRNWKVCLGEYLKRGVINEI